MPATEAFAILNCRDLVAAKALYVDVFGAAQSYGWSDGDDEVYVSLSLGSSSLALGLGTGPAMYGQTPLPASGHAVDLCVYVSDLEDAVAGAPEHGGRVVVEPTDTPWGERVAYLADPEGTMILTIQGPDPA